MHFRTYNISGTQQRVFLDASAEEWIDLGFCMGALIKEGIEQVDTLEKLLGLCARGVLAWPKEVK